MSKKNITVAIVAIAFTVLVFSDTAAFVDNGRRGIMLFGQNVLPVLFPFFFISSLLIECKVFGKRGSLVSTILLSYLSGFPTSARILSQLYTNGEITRRQAIITSTYTTTTSPIFIIATIGTVLYKSTILGVIIFVSHIMGALINGIVFSRFAWKYFIEGHKVQKVHTHATEDIGIGEAISKSLYSSIQSIFAVGGLIVVFFIVAAPVTEYFSLAFGTPIAAILEMTNGVFLASELSSIGIWRAVIPCAIVSFGGLCVAMQGFIFLKSFKMPVWFYFLYKITHTVFSIVICAILIILM